MYKLLETEISKIIVNKNQPRKIFNEESLNELSASIKEYGLIQPLVVTTLGDDYLLVAGERRLRAAKKAGLKNVPVIINDMEMQDVSKVAIIENIQREDLTAIEEAYAYKQLIQQYKLTQTEIAQGIGKTQSSIANKIRLLKLDTKVQEAILNREITERHGRALLRVDLVKQQDLLAKVLENDYTVKQLEQIINRPERAKTATIRKIGRKEKIALNTLKQTAKLLEKNGIDFSYEVANNEDSSVVTFIVKKD